MSLSWIVKSSSTSVELCGCKTCEALVGASPTEKSSELTSSRQDLHSDMDLTVDKERSLLHTTLPHTEQQDIDLNEYVVVEVRCFDFIIGAFLEWSLTLEKMLQTKSKNHDHFITTPLLLVCHHWVSYMWAVDLITYHIRLNLIFTCKVINQKKQKGFSCKR